MGAEAIRQKLDRARARLLDVLDRLDDAALDARGADGWSVREVVTHVINAEEDHCRVAAVIVRGELDRLPRELDLDAHNQARVAERGHLSLAELRRALADQRVRTEALLQRAAAADRLDASGPHPVLGDTTVGNIFRVMALHDQMHTRDILALLDADTV